MKPLLFATTNTVKFRTGHAICQKYGVVLEQLTALDIPEIQAHDGEEVARDKAQRAFEVVQKPLLISDDSWIIPGLKGFPGPFMKFVNQMFTLQDWLRLTTPLSDRQIILRQILVYQDHEGQKLFSTDVEGLLLAEPRGHNKANLMSITSFDDGKHSVAEMHADGRSSIAASSKPTAWHDLCDWYKAHGA